MWVAHWVPLSLLFLYRWWGRTHTVIDLGSVLLSSGFLLLLIALLADLISVNRKLLEKIDRRMSRLEKEQMEQKHVAATSCEEGKSQ